MPKYKIVATNDVTLLPSVSSNRQWLEVSNGGRFISICGVPIQNIPPISRISELGRTRGAGVVGVRVGLTLDDFELEIVNV